MHHSHYAQHTWKVFSVLVRHDVLLHVRLALTAYDAQVLFDVEVVLCIPPLKDEAITHFRSGLLSTGSTSGLPLGSKLSLTTKGSSDNFVAKFCLMYQCAFSMLTMANA